jgi:arginyl-tRNA synthetase
VIVLDLRRAIARAITEAGCAADMEPKLRPGGRPGTYASSVALGLAGAAGQGNKRPALDIARTLASRLGAEDWIARAAVTGDGYVTVAVTPQALASVAARISAAAAGCVSSDVLRGAAAAAMPPADLEGASTWEDARAALAAELTTALAAAAGATVATEAVATEAVATEAVATEAVATEAAAAQAAAEDGGRQGRGRSGHGRDDDAGGTGHAGQARRGPVGEASAFAGADAVRFALARAIPGKPVRVDPASVARNSLDNPAYAVRYAHARAVSGVRWTAALTNSEEAVLPCLPADAASWALLDALSWLPERVAVAARRGRPDEFARYLEGLASATIAALPFVGPADDERLALIQAMARAARTALAAGLGLLGIAAPGYL